MIYRLWTEKIKNRNEDQIQSMNYQRSFEQRSERIFLFLKAERNVPNISERNAERMIFAKIW